MPAISTGRRLARAAYTAAVKPAGPEPRISRREWRVGGWRDDMAAKIIRWVLLLPYLRYGSDGFHGSPQGGAAVRELPRGAAARDRHDGDAPQRGAVEYHHGRRRCHR